MGSLVQPDTFKFTKQDRLYQLTCGGAVLADMSHVALAFSAGGNGEAPVVHQFGTSDTVLRWFRWAKNEYERIGLTDFADDLHYLISDKWDLDDLNGIISNGDALAAFLVRTGIMTDDSDPNRPSETRIPGIPV